MLARHHELTRSAIARHGGEEIDTQGDAFFVVFRSPREAVAAALELQRDLLSKSNEESVRVRMGLHAGEASRTSTGLVGLEIHRAARIASAAHGGQVLLSESVEILVQDGLPEDATLRDLGHRRLKDLGRPEHIFQLEAPGLIGDFPPLRSLDNPALPNNLPAQLGNFVGREHEVAAVRELVTRNRLVTLTGPGGAGKTRLALQVAAEMLDGTGDGVWLVELAKLDDEGAVPDAIASALGLSLAGGPSLDALSAALAPQTTLIILDNCEHLISGCAKVADTLLRRGPHVHLLATSREPLGITGETIYLVPSLTLPDEDEDGIDPQESDAVALLLDRAHAQGVDLELDRTTGSLLASICRRLDGMPLAIELAAARLRTLSLEALEQRLDQRFRLLTGGSRSAPERQQTLRATVGWSISLLNFPERALLNRLSIFVGGFDLEAAEQVCGLVASEEFQVTDLLGSLVDKSLVVAQRRGTQIRYRLLETIREYAAEALLETGDRDLEEAATAHARYFLALSEEAASELDGPNQTTWFERLDLEEPNIARAIEFCSSQPDGIEMLLRFGKALRRAWMLMRGQSKRLVRAAVEDPRAEEHPSLLAHALVSCCLGARGGEAELALPYSMRGLELARTLGDERLLLDALFSRATASYFASRPEEGMAAGQEGVERARRLGDPRMLASSLMAFLLCADDLDSSATQQVFTEAINASVAAGDEDLRRTLLNNAAVHELRRGDLTAARAHLEAAIAAGEDHLPGRMHSVLINLGWVLWQQGELDRAWSMFLRSLRFTRRNGDLSGESYGLLGFACLLAEHERWEEAVETLRVARKVRERAGGSWEDPESAYFEWCVQRIGAAMGDALGDDWWSRDAASGEELVEALVRGWPVSAETAGLPGAVADPSARI